MALVGVIAAGVVEKILQSVAFAGADVLVLFNHENASGHVLIEKGKLVTARLGELRDEEAVAALRGWSSGHYTLIKRGHADQPTRGHVALSLPDTRPRRALARWLKGQDYETSVIANPQQSIETITFLQPDLVLLHCPKRTLDLTCAQLDERLGQEMRLPPALVVLDSGPPGCREQSPKCVRTVATTDALEQALGFDWTGTRLGVRIAQQEQTAKIARPPPSPLPPGKRPSEEMLALALAASAPLPPDSPTLPDLLLALAILLVGSAAIWIGLW